MDVSSSSVKGAPSHENGLDTLTSFLHHGEEIGLAKSLSQQTSSLATAPAETRDVAPSPGEKISELLKEKEGEWAAVVAKKGSNQGPIRLLDLPLDVLKEILKEVRKDEYHAPGIAENFVQVTHTNDLTSLALTCSALHAIVIPMIYSRFDIVWPDASSSSEARSGVDALTYGLATLVMREDLFQNVPRTHTCQDTPQFTSTPYDHYECKKCGMINGIVRSDQPMPREYGMRRGRGNYFSEFTRKFSLGNGPADWVQEYLVTKESGKMLGTLICLAIARMPNLESFVWDMPTGILRDIWMALASLGDYKPSKLSKVWVRLHDNKAAMQESGLPYPEHPPPTIPNLHRTNVPLVELPGFSRLEWSNHPTERPNFSRLPPLQSLTVLAIDEISYIDEISKLIGESRERLRELRIGFATKIHTSGYKAQNPIIQCFCLGAELSLLLNAIDDSCDPRSKKYMHRNKSEPESGDKIDDRASGEVSSSQTINPSDVSSVLPVVPVVEAPNHALEDEVMSNRTMPVDAFDVEPANPDPSIDPALIQPTPDKAACEESQASAMEESSEHSPALESSAVTGQDTSIEASQSHLAIADTRSQQDTANQSIPAQKDTRLTLETLELEGCFVTIHPLRTTINFLHLTSLTLLNCNIQEKFWSDLGRLHPPQATRQRSLEIPVLTSRADPNPVKARLRRMPSLPASSNEPEYPLKIKRIHTDTVSVAFLSFLKESLAPNSLEWLFLQDSPTTPSLVTIDSICKGPLRRHRASLTKVMIDSSVGQQGSRPRTNSAQKWSLGREALNFVTSGKMCKLRELAIVTDYKDWHFLLQRLPNIPQLRSLYVPQIINHVYGSTLNVKDLAMVVLNAVNLRPEIQLCYLGVSTKCFEILEKPRKPKQPGGSAASTAANNNDSGDDSDVDGITAEEDEDEVEVITSENAAGGDTTASADQVEPEDDWSPSEDDTPKAPKEKVDFKLREILFYDDKISIFKARHGRL